MKGEQVGTYVEVIYWWFGVAVTAVVASTKLLHVGLG